MDRAEQILKEGLEVAGVRDRADISGRLADIYEDSGREDEAEEIRASAWSADEDEIYLDDLEDEEGGHVLRIRFRGAPAEKGISFDDLDALAALLTEVTRPDAPIAPKTGRNDPCPCGSGKKFKRCCGA